MIWWNIWTSTTHTEHGDRQEWGESRVESQNYRIMYSLVYTPTYKCRERHSMGHQTITMSCQVALERSPAPTEPQSHPLPTCAGTNSFPWSFVLCSLQERMDLLCLPDLSHSRALSRPLQWGFKGFCACFNQFRHVRQVSAVEVPANYTIWLLQWARLQAKGESRAEGNEGNINPAICRGGTFKNRSK